MDRLVTLSGRGTSPAWGPPLPYEQALTQRVDKERSIEEQIFFDLLYVSSVYLFR